MGYTHTWHIAESSTDPRTADIGDDVRMLMMKSEMPVCLDSDQADQPPCIDDEKIQFNGPGEDGAETFWYPPSPDNAQWGLPEGLDQCKTYRRPYDIIVASALISIKHHLGDGVITSSDGRIDEEEWQAAINLYRGAFPDRSLPPGFIRDYGGDSQQPPLMPAA